MRRPKRLWIVAVTLSFIIVAVTVSLLLHRSELIWKGKFASHWISRLNHFDLDGANSSAEEFLFSAGPRVIPELIDGLKRKDSRLADWWYDWYFKLGKWQKYFSIPTKRSHYRMNCAMGLGRLGRTAADAVTSLLQALNDSDPYVRAKAAEALGRIGVDKQRVVPALIAGLGSTNANFRLACVIGLSHSLPGSAEAAQALRELLKDPDWNIRAWAAESLCRDDSDREATLAALLGALVDGHSTVRDRAAQSLGKFEYSGEQRAKALHVALQQELRLGGNDIVDWKIISSLGEIGPPAVQSIPVLTNLLTHTNHHTAVRALIALGRIQPDREEWTQKLILELDHVKAGSAMWAAWELGKRGNSGRNAVPALLETAKHAQAAGNWQSELMAAAAAWRLDPASPNPIPAITNILSQRHGGRYEFVRLLGELGAAARPAIPTLRQLRYSHGIMMHDYANDALKTVAPEYLMNPWGE